MSIRDRAMEREVKQAAIVSCSTTAERGKEGKGKRERECVCVCVCVLAPRELLQR